MAHIFMKCVMVFNREGTSGYKEFSGESVKVGGVLIRKGKGDLKKKKNQKKEGRGETVKTSERVIRYQTIIYLPKITYNTPESVSIHNTCFKWHFPIRADTATHKSHKPNTRPEKSV